MVQVIRPRQNASWGFIRSRFSQGKRANRDFGLVQSKTPALLLALDDGCMLVRL